MSEHQLVLAYISAANRCNENLVNVVKFKKPQSVGSVAADHCTRAFSCV